MNKKQIGLIGVAAVATVAVLGGIICISSNSGSKEWSQKVSMRGVVDEDDVAHVALSNGKIVTVDDAMDVVLSNDERKLIVLDKDQNLYVSDLKGENKKKIDKDCLMIYDNSGKFITYASEGMRFSYACIETGKKLDCEPEFVYWPINDGNNDIIYFVDSDDEELKAWNGSKDITICEIDDAEYTRILSVNEKGNVIYASCNDDKAKVYITKGSNSEKLCSINMEGRYSNIYMNNILGTNTGFLMASNDKHSGYFLDEKQKLHELDLDNDIVNVYTKNTDIKNTTDTAKEYYLVTTDDYDEYNNNYHSRSALMNEDDYLEYQVTYVDKKYNTKEIIDDLKGAFISNGYLYYIDKHGNLYEAKLNGSRIKNEKEIDDDVVAIDPTSGNGYIYYVKNASDDGLQDLYVVKHGSEAKKICGNVESYKSAYNSSYPAYDLKFASDNHSTIYFFKNRKEDRNYSSHDTMTLCKYSFGDKEYEKIDNKVLLNNTLVDNRNLSDISRITYCKQHEHDGKYSLDYCVYDGKKTKVLEEDIKLK